MTDDAKPLEAKPYSSDELAHIEGLARAPAGMLGVLPDALRAEWKRTVHERWNATLNEMARIHEVHMARLQSELDRSVELHGWFTNQAWDFLQDDAQRNCKLQKKYDASEAENAKLLERLAELTNERDQLKRVLSRHVDEMPERMTYEAQRMATARDAGDEP